MNVLKKMMAFVLIMALGLSLCACANQQSEIKTLTKNFENACNKLELNAMLDCIEPDISRGVKAVTGIIGMFSDNDTDELLEKFGNLLFKELPGNSKEFFTSIKINLDDVELKEDSASALAQITYEISGEEYKTNAKFDYTCIDKVWYISNLDIE